MIQLVLQLQRGDSVDDIVNMAAIAVVDVQSLQLNANAD
jgi:phosphotransacetylase